MNEKNDFAEYVRSLVEEAFNEDCVGKTLTALELFKALTEEHVANGSTTFDRDEAFHILCSFRTLAARYYDFCKANRFYIPNPFYDSELFLVEMIEQYLYSAIRHIYDPIENYKPKAVAFMEAVADRENLPDKLHMNNTMLDKIISRLSSDDFYLQ